MPVRSIRADSFTFTAKWFWKRDDGRGAVTGKVDKLFGGPVRSLKRRLQTEPLAVSFEPRR